MNISKFAKEIIEGVGGLDDYERYEMAIPKGRKEIVVAKWTIECLANPGCEGSEEILSVIIKKRKEREEKTEAEREKSLFESSSSKT